MSHNELPLFYVFHFYLFGIIAVASALAFVTRRSPVAAALWLVTTMFSLAAMYVLLDAQFIGVIQVLVYAGAIMVVFLFVIMLLNLGHASEVNDARGMGWKLAAGLVGLALLAQVFALTRARVPESLALRENAVADQVAAKGAPGLRGDERAAARRGRRRGRPRQEKGDSRCSLSRSSSVRCCSRSASSVCSRGGTRSSCSCASS
jgi:NADH-quinone oxidoreductase subunit J